MKEQKEVEECFFEPVMATKRHGQAAANERPRNLDKFLEDQRRFEEMKKQKMLVRQEESMKSQISQTIHGPYMNDKSKRILEQKQMREHS